MKLNWIELTLKKGYEYWVACACLCKVLYIYKPKTIVVKECKIWKNMELIYIELNWEKKCNQIRIIE